ncbi:MAG: radical SAM protein [Polyangiaceae bacterium]
MAERSKDQMLWREEVANKPKHWVRAVTACNSRCLFCLDSDTPRNVYLDEADIKREIDRGIDELGAEKIIISGGEATLHPKFVDLVRYAKERGYDRVQTVTNGYRFAEKAFYLDSVNAGLGEITFSLHGHTAELHDHLTGTPDAFRRLVKGMVRALRDGRVIVNVDVVINKQNVAVIDKIVELCISLGVTEFDLLHVIPQAAAFDHRDELFYDVRDHLPVLQKVFRLNRHPRFVIWTNRFPVSYLEGLEDLIQDPHKMLDEVNGRRFQVRRYLDDGNPLDCRDPERCPHCFIEPFCTTVDRVVARQHDRSWEVYWLGENLDRRHDSLSFPLAFGCTTVGLAVERMADLALDLPEGVGLYATVGDAGAPPTSNRPLTLVAREPSSSTPGSPRSCPLASPSRCTSTAAPAPGCSRIATSSPPGSRRDASASISRATSTSRAPPPTTSAIPAPSSPRSTSPSRSAACPSASPPAPPGSRSARSSKPPSSTTRPAASRSARSPSTTSPSTTAPRACAAPTAG